MHALFSFTIYMILLHLFIKRVLFILHYLYPMMTLYRTYNLLPIAYVRYIYLLQGTTINLFHFYPLSDFV